MPLDDDNPLVPRKGDGLVQAGGGERLLSRMAEGVLERLRSWEQALRGARFRVGKYDFREPDYWQILRWAEVLDLSPEKVLAALESTRFEDHYDAGRTVEFTVVDGGLSSLAWDFQKLPMVQFEWGDEVRIRMIAFLSDEPLGLLPGALPPSLQTLECGELGLEGLDLSDLRDLTVLSCPYNQLIELDLMPVPQIARLVCYGNKLTSLDLSSVPHLTSLWCGYNPLTELNLSSLSLLTWLWCEGNQLTELDLSSVPQLTWLWCEGNQLTELDLSPVSQLEWLSCHENQLTELDISPLRRLEILEIDPDVRIIGTPPDGCKVTRR